MGVGGTIDIGPGTFPAAVSLSMSGTVTFEGADATDVSGGTVVEPTTSMGTTFGSNRSHLNLDQVTVDGLGGDAVGAGYGSTVTIVDSTITNSDEAGDVLGPPAAVILTDVTLDDNTVGVDSADASSGARSPTAPSPTTGWGSRRPLRRVGGREHRGRQQRRRLRHHRSSLGTRATTTTATGAAASRPPTTA